ncbi:outer membrane beta-barrel protein [Novosphingobium sp. PC22D]|uniref:outer membrane beta-barrel protein n=1 Tax=Novosphingobium sp. PC22D TaxID=1962403 RepID=UPI00143C5DB0|nr:outer membrane beta-barrel protein [Novosphingobium sp. PC22D]
MRSAILAGAAGLALPAGPASAQNSFGPFLESPIPLDIDRGRQVSVLDRARPEYEADGVIVGGFTVYPEAQVGVGVTSNVFAAPDDAKSAAFLTFDPRLRAASNWLRHGVSVSAAGAFRRYIDRSIRNEDGLAARIDGRLDVSSDLKINGAAGISRGYQSQYSSEIPANAVAPIEFVKAFGQVRATYGVGRVRATIAGDVNGLDFKDAKLGTTLLDQDFRDRTVTRGAARIEYSAFSDVWIFGEVSASDIDYRLATIGQARPNRDGSDYRYLAGTSFDFTALARARVGIGYIERTFKSPIYRNLSGFGYDARIEFFPSGLTTISAAAQRSIGEAVTVNSSGYFSNELLLRADHELLRNLLLFGQVRYARNRFEGIDRRDNIWIAEGGANFLIDRNLRLSGGLAYSDRTSKGINRGQEFDEIRGIVALALAI